MNDKEITLISPEQFKVDLQQIIESGYDQPVTISIDSFDKPVWGQTQIDNPQLLNMQPLWSLDPYFELYRILTYEITLTFMKRKYTSGYRQALADVLNHLNTYESIQIDKEKLYSTITKFDIEQQVDKAYYAPEG